MKLFIANCTKQAHDFVYRLPEMPVGSPGRLQRIEVGGQIRLSGDLSTPDIEAVVQQHSRYGLVSVSELTSAKSLVTLVYSIDKPISEETIRYAIGQNSLSLTERGRLLRQEAAVAVNNRLAEQSPNAGLKSVELSVVEEASKSNPDPTLAEGVIVSLDAPEGAPPAPVHRGRGRPRKAA